MEKYYDYNMKREGDEWKWNLFIELIKYINFINNNNLKPIKPTERTSVQIINSLLIWKFIISELKTELAFIK